MGVVNTCSGTLLLCLKRTHRDYCQVAIKDGQNEMERRKERRRRTKTAVTKPKQAELRGDDDRVHV